MLWPLRCPSTAGSVPACSSAAPRVPPGGTTTPSLSWASWRNCPPLSGSSCTRRLSMTSLISAFAICSSGTAPVTVTFSVRSPSGSVIASSTRWPTCTVTFDRVMVLKPSSVTVTVYSPTGRAGMKNRPASSDARSTLNPLETPTTRTDAPGSNPPSTSLTTPWSSAVLVCARSGVSSSPHRVRAASTAVTDRRSERSAISRGTVRPILWLARVRDQPIFYGRVRADLGSVRNLEPHS